MAISVSQLDQLIEGDIVLYKLGDEFFPVEIKLIVNKNLSKYIVGTDGVAYILDDLYIEAQ